jgi:DNA-binding transcriptional LysR family regulator
MIFNERILRVVVVLAEDLHFGRAAARLHVSQPALSGTLKSLEREIGVRLFKRSTRNVELTEAGRVFVNEARRLAQESERALSLVRAQLPDAIGPLRIGYPASFNVRWLSSLISAANGSGLFRDELRFVSTDAGNLHEELISGALHAAFFAGPVADGDLTSTSLFREPFKLVTQARHPLAHGELVSFDRLANEPVVWLSRDIDPALHSGVVASCSARGYRPNVVHEVSTFCECLEFARQGLGITFLPSFMQAYCRDECVSFVRLPKQSLRAEYRLATRAQGTSEAGDRFVEFASQHARDTLRAFQCAGHA